MWLIWIPLESGTTVPSRNYLSRSLARSLTGVSTMLGLLFLKVLTAWKTSTTLCLLAISHTMLLAQKTPLRPPPFLSHKRHDTTHRVPVKNVKAKCASFYWSTSLHSWVWTNDHFLLVCFMRHIWEGVKIWIMQINIWTQFDLWFVWTYFHYEAKDLALLILVRLFFSKVRYFFKG